MFRKYYHIKINLQLDKLKEIGIEYTKQELDGNLAPDKLFELYITFFPRGDDRILANEELRDKGVFKIEKTFSTSNSALRSVGNVYTPYCMLEDIMLKTLERLKFLIDAGMLSYTTSDEPLYLCSISLSNKITGSKLELVKFIKDATGLGLKESKDIVDAAIDIETKTNKSVINFNLTESEIVNFNQVVIDRNVSPLNFHFDGHLVLRNNKLEKLLND
jgi:hypothetical protein